MTEKTEKTTVKSGDDSEHAGDSEWDLNQDQAPLNDEDEW